MTFTMAAATGHVHRDLTEKNKAQPSATLSLQHIRRIINACKVQQQLLDKGYYSTGPTPRTPTSTPPTPPPPTALNLPLTQWSNHYGVIVNTPDQMIFSDMILSPQQSEPSCKYRLFDGLWGEIYTPSLLDESPPPSEPRSSEPRCKSQLFVPR